MAIKIFGDAGSGNCLKVKYTADYLGLDYDWIEVDILQGESRTEEFLAKNVQGQVPVVELADGRCLAQSNAILGYLSDNSVLDPGDAYLRAKVQELLFWEQYSHEPYIAVCRFRMHYLGEPKGAREAWRVERGERALDLMEQMLEGDGWLVGDDFTIADIALLAYTRLAHEGGFELASRAHVANWVGRCEARLGLPSLA